VRPTDKRKRQARAAPEFRPPETEIDPFARAALEQATPEPPLVAAEADPFARAEGLLDHDRAAAEIRATPERTPGPPGQTAGAPEQTPCAP
jgi:hypothetical protein